MHKENHLSLPALALALALSLALGMAGGAAHAELSADDAGPDDSRNALGMLFVDGEFNISRQNYFVYWFVVGLSFIALLLIARDAAAPDRRLARDGIDLRADRWVYLRPVVVCAATAVVGLISPAIGDLTLVVGIITSVLVARRSAARSSAAG